MYFEPLKGKSREIALNIIICLSWFSVGVLLSLLVMESKCTEKGFIQIFENSYYCNKSSRTYGYEVK